MLRYLLIYLFAHLFISASTFAQQQYYYPPNTGNTWDTLSPDSLGWCQDSIQSLYNFLDAKNSKSFIVLKDGKIVLEKYFDSFTQDSFWYYASAGKSVMAFLIGMAQEEGLLDINMPVSTYLGNGWTDCPAPKEDLITVWHQLSMTTGLDDGLAATPQIPEPLNCLDDSCLQYKADAGSRWAYHNAPYRLVQDVLEQASGATKNQFTRTRLLRPIGMQGFWLNYVFYGKARDMARFGHLVLSNGVWDGDTIMGDTAYMKAMSTPSQGINESYGLLWWLNGQASYMLPRQQFQLSGEMMPPAPSDMFAALGKNDQKIYVIPSLDMVIVRQGNSAGNIALAGSSFDSELWEKINGLSCGATSLEDDFMEEKISLYPQPAQDELWVDMPEAMSGPSFHLYSLEGKRIQSLSSSQVGNTFLLQIGDIPAGLYILEIHSEGHFLRKKISIY